MYIAGSWGGSIEPVEPPPPRYGPGIKLLGLYLTVSEIFIGECDTMAYLTLNYL